MCAPAKFGRRAGPGGGGMSGQRVGWWEASMLTTLTRRRNDDDSFCGSFCSPQIAAHTREGNWNLAVQRQEMHGKTRKRKCETAVRSLGQ